MAEGTSHWMEGVDCWIGEFRLGDGPNKEKLQMVSRESRREGGPEFPMTVYISHSHTFTGQERGHGEGRHFVQLQRFHN